jgi:hypothetical protein
MTSSPGGQKFISVNTGDSPLACCLAVIGLSTFRQSRRFFSASFLARFAALRSFCDIAAGFFASLFDRCSFDITSAP